MISGEVAMPNPAEGNVIHDLYLNIPTTVEHNETEVHCVATGGGSIWSDATHLYIQGEYYVFYIVVVCKQVTTMD